MLRPPPIAREPGFVTDLEQVKLGLQFPRRGAGS